MKFVIEIGLNHLGDKYILDRYFRYLSKLDIDFSLTLQIIENDFIKKNKISKKILDHEYLLKKLLNFNKRYKNEIGIATDICLNKDILYKFNLKFIKILSKDFNNNKLINHYLNLNYDVYVSTGGKSYHQIKKKFTSMKKYSKILNFIITDFTSNPFDLSFSKIKKLQKDKINNISYGIHYQNLMPGYLSFLFNLKKLFFYVKLENDLKYPDNYHALRLTKVLAFYNEMNYISNLIDEKK